MIQPETCLKLVIIESQKCACQACGGHQRDMFNFIYPDNFNSKLHPLQTLEEELLRHQPAALLRLPLQEGFIRGGVRRLRPTSGFYLLRLA